MMVFHLTSEPTSLGLWRFSSKAGAFKASFPAVLGGEEMGAAVTRRERAKVRPIESFMMTCC